MATTAPSKAPKRLAPSSQAASLTGLSPSAMSRRVRAGVLQSWIDPSDNRVRLVDLDELEQYLANPRPARRSSDPGRAA